MSGVVAIDSNNALSFSSFGAENTTFGNGFRARSILDGDRYQMLDRKQSLYECTQHDHKKFDFDGRVSSPRSAQPLIGAEKASFFVPLKMRRPLAPYRLPKIIVDSFTNILFGEQRFPAIRYTDDPRTEDYAQTISRVGRLPLKMIQARNYGGSMGTAAVSWGVVNGRPRFEAHNPKNLFVHSWEDRVNLIPRHVTEVYKFHKDQWDGKQFAKIPYWFRRDWTRDWDIVFEDQPVDKNGRDPIWVPSMKKSVRHMDGLCHLVWIQNLPTDEIDGSSDYEGLEDSFEALDLLFSVVMKGAILNLDPTLKLKIDPDLVSAMGVKKGSDNALVVGESGDAEYMELGGSSIESGTKLIELERRSILETAQCIVPDPHEVAAQGVSSVAIKAMFAPMISKADVLREQYGTGIERLLEGLLVVARAASRSTVVVTDETTGQPMTDEAGQPLQEQAVFDLPTKLEKQLPIDPLTGQPALDPMTLQPLPEQNVRVAREPGDGVDLELRWPPYFPPTPDDQSKIVTTMQLATGGKAFVSVQTATEIAAGAFGLDPKSEVERLAEQAGAEQQEMAAMTPSIGGPVSDPNALPAGAVSRETGVVPPEPAEGNPPPNPHGNFQPGT